MTFATDAGFVVGKTYRVKSSEPGFKVGEELKLVRDDRTELPEFRRPNGHAAYPYLHNMSNVAIEDETPAQKAGLVVGQKYTLTDSAYYGEAGDEVIFERDDGSDMPKFRVPSTGDSCYIDLKKIGKYVEKDIKYRTRLLPGKTKMKVNRVLTSSQIARIEAILMESK